MAKLVEQSREKLISLMLESDITEEAEKSLRICWRSMITGLCSTLVQLTHFKKRQFGGTRGVQRELFCCVNGKREELKRISSAGVFLNH